MSWQDLQLLLHLLLLQLLLLLLLLLLRRRRLLYSPCNQCRRSVLGNVCEAELQR
jgi:hypothetical protein